MIFASAAALCTIPWGNRIAWVGRCLLPKSVYALAVSKIILTQESIMSARNGDRSRFNRERKQKIARRKRTREQLMRLAEARKSADITVRAQPSSVSS